MASASASACLKHSESPSPVTASTDPEASPSRATLPRVTLRNLRFNVIELLGKLLDEAAPSRAWRPGKCSSAASALKNLFRATKITQTSSSEIGVTYACP